MVSGDGAGAGGQRYPRAVGASLPVPALLEPRLEQAREEARQKCRVQVALGLFSGIVLSLLLL